MRTETVLRFLLSPKHRLVVFILASFTIGISTFFLGAFSPFTVWNASRAVTVDVAIGIVLAIPPRDITRFTQKFLYIIGFVAFTVTEIILYFGRTYEGPGDEKVYEVCALTLPVLLLAVVIDIHLFEGPGAHPGWIFLNLFMLVGGEGASLLALSSGSGSRGLFSWAVASMTGIFTTIIASTIGKSETRKTRDTPTSPPGGDSISLLVTAILWITDTSLPGSSGHPYDPPPEKQTRGNSDNDQPGKSST